MAAAPGTVVYAGDEMKGFGNLVLIRHEGDWVTAYAHLDRVMVKQDSVVAEGDEIGTVGKTGNVSTPQLHFETRQGGKPVDPAGVVKGNLKPINQIISQRKMLRACVWLWHFSRVTKLFYGEVLMWAWAERIKDEMVGTQIVIEAPMALREKTGCRDFLVMGSFADNEWTVTLGLEEIIIVPKYAMPSSEWDFGTSPMVVFKGQHMIAAPNGGEVYANAQIVNFVRKAYGLADGLTPEEKAQSIAELNSGLYLWLARLGQTNARSACGRICAGEPRNANYDRFHIYS